MRDHTLLSWIQPARMLSVLTGVGRETVGVGLGTEWTVARVEAGR